MTTGDPKFSLQTIAREKLMRFDPLKGLTPQRLTQALDAFRAGSLRDLAVIMEAQEERDDVLASVVPKAKAGVARHGWEIQVIDTHGDAALAEQAAKQKAALENFYNQLRVTSAMDQDELGGVSLLLRQMMDAKGKRYAVHHIVWKPVAGGYTATLWFVPLWFFENRTGRMRFVETSFGYDGVAMDPAEWIVTKGQGISIACAVAWMYKHMPLNDWLAVCDRWAEPLIEGLTDAPMNSPEWDQLKEAVADLAGGDAIVHARGAEIKTTQVGNAGNQPHPPLVERMDRALATLWRGGDLSTMSKDGQAVGSNAQSGETDLLESDDAMWLSETLQLKLDRLLLDNVFGADVPALAYFQIRRPNKQNTELDVKVDEFAMKIGHPISKQQFAERYQRPIPVDAKPEDLLKSAPASPPFGAAPAFAAANERANAGRAAVYRSEALQKLSAAQAEALRPLTDRLAEIAGIEDETAQEAALMKLKTDLPALYRQIAADPVLATAFEDILGAALVSGAATAAEKKDLP